jgi:hypothetical protein
MPPYMMDANSLRRVAEQLDTLANALRGFIEKATEAGDRPDHQDPLDKIADHLKSVNTEVAKLGGPDDHSAIYGRIGEEFEAIAGEIESLGRREGQTFRPATDRCRDPVVQ